MSIPEKYLAIKNKFAEALRTGNFSTTAAIPLDDLKMAKIHLSSENGQPYYTLLLNTITEKEKTLVETKEGVKVAGVESNYARNQHIYLAHRFTEDPLLASLKKIIERQKYFWVTAKNNDLGKISSDVLAKIKKSGFFIAIMTHQHALKDGNYTANSWVLEEKAAALAFGHRPIIMLEEGVERHYAGYVQSEEQIIPFTKANFEIKAEGAVKTIDATFKKFINQGLI